MANGIGYDLIVKDDNCERIANEYYKLGNRFEEYVNRYSEILNRVANDGIKSGICICDRDVRRRKEYCTKNVRRSGLLLCG